jgi:mono/diheme cytochrome c family protein
MIKAAVAAFSVLAWLMPLHAETLLARGDYLVNTVMACGNCHTPKDASGQPIMNRSFSGGLTFDTPAFKVTAPNITPDRETGIGDWSADEIKTALTTGVSQNGRHLMVMPAYFYKALTPFDLNAIVTYIRSVPPVRNAVPTPDYRASIPPQEPYPDAAKSYTDADMKNPVEHGRYLATIGHCMECHTTFERGTLQFSKGLGRGGRIFALPGVKGPPTPENGVVTPNITSSKTAGIGDWSDVEIARAITQGIAKDGHHFRPPMAVKWYAKMRESDVRDIIAWLRTVPPLD